MLVLRVLAIAIASLFFLKIAWNLGVPYVMCARLMRNPEDRAKRMSLMPGVEVVLFLAWMATAFLSRGRAWAIVGVVGLLSIVGSRPSAHCRVYLWTHWAQG